MKLSLKNILFLFIMLAVTIFADTNNDSNEFPDNIEYNSIEQAAIGSAEIIKIALNEGINVLAGEVETLEEYVEKLNNNEVKFKWEYIYENISNPIDVEVLSTKNNASFGSVTYLVKALNEDDMWEYLQKNADKYLIVSDAELDDAEKLEEYEVDLEVDFEKYIDLQYDYIKNTPKQDVMKMDLEFYQVNGKWKVLSKNRN